MYNCKPNFYPTLYLCVSLCLHIWPANAYVILYILRKKKYSSNSYSFVTKVGLLRNNILTAISDLVLH